MARMHSRDKGRSGSTKPVEKKIPTWLQYKGKEAELLVVKFAKEGKTPSRIGTYLRDVYGIPDIMLITKKSITQILAERKLLKEIPEDLMALIRKAVFVRKHLESNKKDMPAKRGLQLTESKIGRVVKYYKRVKKLPESWKYDPKRIKLQVE